MLPLDKDLPLRSLRKNHKDLRCLNKWRIITYIWRRKKDYYSKQMAQDSKQKNKQNITKYVSFLLTAVTN